MKKNTHSKNELLTENCRNFKTTEIGNNDFIRQFLDIQRTLMDKVIQ